MRLWSTCALVPCLLGPCVAAAGDRDPAPVQPALLDKPAAAHEHAARSAPIHRVVLCTAGQASSGTQPALLDKPAAAHEHAARSDPIHRVVLCTAGQASSGTQPALLDKPAVAHEHAAPAAHQPGKPWPRHTIDQSSRGADGVRLADVNRDGLPDITTGWEEGGRVRAYLNPGPAKARQPWPAVTVGQVSSPEDAVFADLDGDGAGDVVSSCEGNNQTIYVHWAPRDPARYLDTAAWQTAPIPASAGKTRWMFALPMDVDGQNGVDLIVGSKDPGAMIGWLQSPQDPRRLEDWRLHALRPAAWIMSLQAHDMDGDGDLDVLCSDRKGPRRGVFWLENPGTRAAAQGKPWTEHLIGGRDHQVMFLARGDLDADGRPDVVAATSGSGILFFPAPERAHGAWQMVEIAMPAGCGTGKGVAVCDVDLDGRQDIMLTCEHAGGKSGARWLSYRQSPRETIWQDHEISGPEGEKFDRIEMLDLDADGDLDLVTCCEAQANLGVIWYENPTRKR